MLRIQQGTCTNREITASENALEFLGPLKSDMVFHGKSVSLAP